MSAYEACVWTVFSLAPLRVAGRDQGFRRTSYYECDRSASNSIKLTTVGSTVASAEQPTRYGAYVTVPQSVSVPGRNDAGASGRGTDCQNQCHSSKAQGPSVRRLSCSEPRNACASHAATL